MGQSTDAILFYGYYWDEECDILPPEMDDGWEKGILLRRGVVGPWDAYLSQQIEAMPYGRERDEAFQKWREKHQAELDAWRDTLVAIGEEFGCDVDFHCSENCRMPYVAVNDSNAIAHRGYPKKISSLTVDPSWDGLLERFMTEVGIVKPKGQEGPAWW